MYFMRKFLFYMEEPDIIKLSSKVVLNIDYSIGTIIEKEENNE